MQARLEAVNCWSAKYSGETCGATMSAGQNMLHCMLLVRALLQTCKQLAEQVEHDQEVLLWTNGTSMQQQHTGMQLLGCLWARP